MPPPIVPMP
jgi:hypothetical protein